MSRVGITCGVLILRLLGVSPGRHAWRMLLALLLLVAGVGNVLLAGSARAEPDPTQETLQEILQVLADRGILDEAEHTRLAAKAQSAKGGSRDVASGLLEGLEWSGDLRLRAEGFSYDGDSRGTDRDNRYRARYRARLGFKKKVNDWATVAMQLASGEDDHRSANQTLGSVDEDFDPDSIFIDRVYAELKLPETAGAKAKIHAGKIPIPFAWKHGKDFVVFDNDISFEGAALLVYRPVSESTQLFFHAGGFIVDENSMSKDPKLVGAQLGGTTKLSDEVEAGLRLSGYEWRSVDNGFLGRAVARGNLVSAFDGQARIADISAFTKFTCSDVWPVELWGTYIRNLLADPQMLSGILQDEEDMAWAAGFELGSSSKWLKFGVGHFYVEANSVVAQFTDSDLFEGFTNRKGWMLYAEKKIAPGVEVKLEFFDSDSIKNETGFLPSVADADRKRFRSDLIFSY